MEEPWVETRQAVCPGCRAVLTLHDRSVSEVTCPFCGRHALVYHTPNRIQTIPIKGGAVIIMNLN